MYTSISWYMRHLTKAQAISSLIQRDGSFALHASEVAASYATLTVSVDGTWVSIEVNWTGTVQTQACFVLLTGWLQILDLLLDGKRRFKA
jgi:hypothetical protein